MTAAHPQDLGPEPHRLVAEHQQLVTDLVRAVLARVPSHVDRHDLCLAAGEALVAAARTYEPAAGRRFADHASVAIKVALRDLLRSLPLRTGPTAPSAESLDERLDVLETAIAVLPERQRAVLTSYFLDARPLTRIADDLGLTESRVSLLLSDALVLLRDALDRLVDPPSRRAVGPLRRSGRTVRRTTSVRFEYLGRQRAVAAGRVAHQH